MKRLIAGSLVVPVIVVAWGVLSPAAAEQAQTMSAASPGIVKFSPNMPASALAKRPDTDLVELPGGRRVSVGYVRKMEALGRKMREPQVNRFPPALRAKPAATGARIDSAEDLAAALKGPDGNTVRLPSGRLATVGQIKLLEPLIEKRTGRSLASAPKRPGLSGPAVKVTAKSDWKEILARPDGTVLESPDGTRITVGELKQAFASGGKTPPGATRKGPAPVAAPR